ncbi:hypothetical protein AXK56_14245 [Tsukamurella pulmonis]|uniref:DUF7802 domain-containing protein n=1 Tax=Tsukamurella pulmonis TaxID=47312 RepID=A0A1H1FM34_9ACTN|nr:hypothetical protein [Tsukamurella pulmonis]KXO87589.1 hypothetical protein AXK56_14245 [Tsukamurella pulmonis]SDR02102.1 hypothetical protein SAMN04489765_2800 [Tsukamurella pulmonis]SUP18754.1 Uncharacterised protein [Tsukamurella pulmonis]
MDLCTPTFDALARRMGFTCDDTGGLVSVRSPFQLENWTLPALEVTIIVGSILMLVHAFRRWRQGDATNLAVWFGATAYLFVIEPPLYFPGAFGIEGYVDTMFAHNLFTVEFLWGRLPLYIVAIYPLMATMSFEIVRMLGVFRRCGIILGACTVGLVHGAFYEIFDHLGPQLRWWEWAPDNPINLPFFASVPMGSVVVFAALWPMSLALCVQFMVGRHVDAGVRFAGPQLVWRTVVIGLAASVGTFLLPLPATILGLAGDTVRGTVYALELALMAAAALYAVRRASTAGAPSIPAHRNRLVQTYASLYVVVFAGLWIAALPDYFRAENGVTAAGDPVGNLPFALLCFAVAIGAVASTFLLRAREPLASEQIGSTMEV